jgi:hypothetical protein
VVEKQREYSIIIVPAPVLLMLRAFPPTIGIPDLVNGKAQGRVALVPVSASLT